MNIDAVLNSEPIRTTQNVSRHRWLILVAVAGFFVVGGAFLRRTYLPRLWLNRCTQAVQSQAWSSADRYLARYLSIHGETTESLLLAAQIDAHDGRIDDAIQELIRVPKTSPSAAEARYHLASLHFDRDRAARAERAAQESLELKPGYSSPLRLLFDIYRWEGRDIEAKEVVDQVLDQAPDSIKSMLLRHRFEAEYAQFGTAEAAARLKRFAAADPEDWDARVALATMETEAGRKERARRQFERVLQAQPEHVVCLDRFANWCVKFGDFSRLAVLLESWPSDRRDFRYLRNHAIYAQEVHSDYATAARQLQQVVDEYPDDWQAFHRLGICRAALGETQLAEQATAHAVRIRDALRQDRIGDLLKDALPDLSTPDHCFQVGLFYEDIGYPKRAAEWYELALKIDPDHMPSREALERVNVQRIDNR